jgi:hypothetical protein
MSIFKKRIKTKEDLSELTINQKIQIFHKKNILSKAISNELKIIKEDLLKEIKNVNKETIETEKLRLIYNKRKQRRLIIKKAKEFIIEKGEDIDDYLQNITQEFVTVDNKEAYFKEKDIKLN